MAKLDVEGLYRLGRSHPHGPPHDPYPKLKTQSYEKPDPKQQAVQNREDRPASHDDVGKNWLRGYGKRPGFDAGPSGRIFNK